MQKPNEEQVNRYGRREAVNNERNDTARHITNTMPSLVNSRYKSILYIAWCGYTSTFSWLCYLQFQRQWNLWKHIFCSSPLDETLSDLSYPGLRKFLFLGIRYKSKHLLVKYIIDRRFYQNFHVRNIQISLIYDLPNAPTLEL